MSLREIAPPAQPCQGDKFDDEKSLFHVGAQCLRPQFRTNDQGDRTFDQGDRAQALRPYKYTLTGVQGSQGRVR